MRTAGWKTKNRGKVNIRELQDRIDAANDGKIEQQKRKEVANLDLPSRLNLLFKTVEILGQILKNHYGPLRNSVKNELMDEAFQGPLRAFRHFFEEIYNEREALVMEVESELKRRNVSEDEADRNKIARRVVFDIVGMVSSTFIYKTATSVGSEYLQDVISGLVRQNGSVAYRLIQITSLLDKQDAIPFAEIDRLNSDCENNIFVRRMLQTMVIGHLYMFKTTERDKQKLCSSLGIQMAQQRAIDFKTRKTKKMDSK